MASLQELPVNTITNTSADPDVPPSPRRSLTRTKSLIRRSSQIFKLDAKKIRAPQAEPSHDESDVSEHDEKEPSQTKRKRARENDSESDGQPKSKKMKKSRMKKSSSGSVMEGVRAAAKMVRKKPSSTQLKIRRTGSLIEPIAEGVVSPMTSPRGTPISPRFKQFKAGMRRMSKSWSFPPLKEKGDEGIEWHEAEPIPNFNFIAQITPSSNHAISLFSCDDDGWTREGVPMSIDAPKSAPSSEMPASAVVMDENSAAANGSEIESTPQKNAQNEEDHDVVMGEAPMESEISCDIETKRYKWFTQYFLGEDISHFIAFDNVLDTHALITLMEKPGEIWSLTHTKNGVFRHIAEIVDPVTEQNARPGKKWIKEALVPYSPALSSLSNIREIINDKKTLEESLIKMEKQEEPEQMKFGILNVQPGQTKEGSMFMNTSGSEAYEAFLASIGEKIELKDWKYFNGGLDTERNLTGLHSVYSKYGGYEDTNSAVMFHVSTLIPTVTDDDQNLGKKRHLGNDIVVIVFLDSADRSITGYSPNTIKTHFNHVLCAVTPDEKDEAGEWTYTIQFARKNSVRGFQPPLPPVTHHLKASHLRPFLLCKQHAAYQSSTFQNKLIFTRNALLKNFSSFT